MTWATVGIVTSAARDWTQLPLLVQGSETFRVRQSWEGSSPGDFWITFRSNYPGFGINGYRRVYPSQDDRLLVLAIPEELQQLGLSDRHIEAKLNTYARVFGPANWNLILEVWDGPLLPPPSPGTGTDPYSTDPSSYLNLDGVTYP
jgi:hypothetical protein